MTQRVSWCALRGLKVLDVESVVMMSVKKFKIKVAVGMYNVQYEKLCVYGCIVGIISSSQNVGSISKRSDSVI